MKSSKFFIALASLLGLSAVVIGALSTHTLQQNLSPENVWFILHIRYYLVLRKPLYLCHH